jgi:hypothetical protein
MAITDWIQCSVQSAKSRNYNLASYRCRAMLSTSITASVYGEGIRQVTWVVTGCRVRSLSSAAAGSAWTDGEFGNRVDRGDSWCGTPGGLRSAFRSGDVPHIFLLFFGCLGKLLVIAIAGLNSTSSMYSKVNFVLMSCPKALRA